MLISGAVSGPSKTTNKKNTLYTTKPDVVATWHVNIYYVIIRLL